MELYLYFPYMSPLNVLSGAEVKKGWSYTSIYPLCFNDVDRNNFTVQLETAYLVVSAEKRDPALLTYLLHGAESFLRS